MYCDAESAMALAGAQLPSAVVLPTILIVWPTVVVTSSLNVTATAVGVEQELEVADVVVMAVDADADVDALVEVEVDDGVPGEKRASQLQLCTKRF